jgi:hypothetical protein
MRLLLAAPNGESGDSQDLGTTKRAKYLRAAQSVEKPSQRLCEFSLERAAKRFRVLFETREADAAV